MEFINETFSKITEPYITMLLGLIISLIAKDIATSTAKGLAFKWNSMFNEGDTVIIDDEIAIIVKIGIRNTIFGISKPNGAYAWRFVPNERIVFLKIEKVVRDVNNDITKTNITSDSEVLLVEEKD